MVLETKNWKFPNFQVTTFVTKKTNKQTNKQNKQKTKTKTWHF